ncbi:type IV secretory system conjugative DNA transfer family protein [Clostridium cylindrosporum]|uniref:TraG/TraD family protein n=1 Tax=Clostridium cylindrosporum DSM 605 TaxID=1121307 RepID=A0A0J8DDM0_CLOCY|nr:type IV secretory system conjugative DNA transfer family protein [Clostridium cylindrosporum]KMT22329.1 TraG/TraD family protein [Clostridium cylindrosporum DSM 605]
MLFETMLLTKIAIGGVVGCGLLNVLSKDESSGELATSKIGTVEDLKGLIGDNGLRLGKKIQLNEGKTREHIIVCGATGEGKTTSLFYPNLLTSDIQGSIVVIDPKGELYRDTSRFQESIGRTPILFNPLSPFDSAKYNLLAECRTTSEVVELAQTILLNSSKALELQSGTKAGGIEWLNMSLPLFVSALIYVKSKGSPIDTITSAARLVINHGIEDLDTLLSNSDEEEVREQFNIFKSCLESPKTASSIKVTLNSSLQLFMDNNIIQSSSRTDFNAKMLRDKPICLYISYPEHKSNYLSPYMATFFTQLINQLMETKGQSITFLCDEFANIGMINGFTTIISTCRSRMIGFLICLQSTSQLVQVYGRDNAKAILNNLKTKCVLPSITDIETLNYISDILGDTQITLKNTSKNKSNTTDSYNTSKKRLLSTDEIRRLGSDEILIIPHNRQPFLDKQNLYYVNKKYTSRVSPIR